MTKEQIDKEFTKRIPLFTRVIKGRKVKSQRYSIEPDVVLNETYLHIIKNQSSIETPNDLERMANQFITSNLGWENSKMNTEERLLQLTKNCVPIENEYNKQNAFNIEDSDQDFNNKILIENWYNEKKALLELYYQQEPNQVVRVIFQCYFEKDIRTGKALSKHLGIPINNAYNYLKKMKLNIKEFAKSQY